MGKKDDDKVVEKFQSLVKADRDRKKNEALAKQIFAPHNRRNKISKPKPSPQSAAPPSLASRIGVKDLPSKAQKLAGKVLTRGSSRPKSTVSAGKGPLPAIKTAKPVITPKQSQAQDRASRLYEALQRGHPALSRSGNTDTGMRVRGMASQGPFTVVAENFQSGTSANDIVQAVTPVGGHVLECRVVQNRPSVKAEIVLESMEGAQNIVETFNNKRVDGRLLLVRLQPSPAVYRPPAGPLNQNPVDDTNDDYVQFAVQPPSGPRFRQSGSRSALNGDEYDQYYYNGVAQERTSNQQYMRRGNGYADEQQGYYRR